MADIILQKQSIKDQVYELIRNRILTREYLLDSKINIRSLALELNVSNTPIREALSMLQKEGLVTFSTNAGYQVFSLTAGNIIALEETMAILMMGGYELWCFHKKTDALIAILEEKLERQREIITTGGQTIEIANAAIDFDAAFFSTLDNETIWNLYQTVLGKMILLICYDHMQNKHDLKIAYNEHMEILKAIKDQNSDLVNELIAVHFSREINLL